MSRSVYVPSGAATVLYLPFETEGEDDDFVQEDWKDFVERITEVVKGAEPTLNDSDVWESNEGHVILENSMLFVVLSEYCGLCSLSFVPKSECDDDSVWTPLKGVWEEFATQCISDKRDALKKAFQDAGFVLYALQGRFSNGEAVYQKLA